MLHVWWVWIVGGFVIGCAEVLLPGYIFLGFAIGAVLTGVMLGMGLLATASISTLFLVFAVLSLIAWVALRMVLGKHSGQVKIWERDINDN
jgi:inner membrane protein